MKKKILIISGGTLPVPAKLGGAVETLIDSVIEENKEAGLFDIDVVSCAETDSYERIEGVARYINIKYPWLVRFCDMVLFFYSGKIKKDWRSMFLRNKYKSDYYRRKIKEKLDFSDYEAVIVENNMSLLDVISERMGNQFSERCFYHMHSVLVDNQSMIPYLASCKKILTVSDYVTRELKKNVPEFENTTIEKVVNGIVLPKKADEFYLKARSKLRSKHHISENSCVFLYSGRLSIEKGAVELLNAFTKANLSDCVLVYVGSAISGCKEITPYVAGMKALAEKYSEKVIFTGYIDYEHILEYYYMADVLVVPSIVGDAAPLTVLEGMACGVPIISAKIGGIPEYAQDYRDVYWAEPGDYFVDNLKEQLKLFSEKYKHDNQNVTLTDQRNENKLCFDTKTFFNSFGKAIMG